jgi:hypothetical protein
MVCLDSVDMHFRRRGGYQDGGFNLQIFILNEELSNTLDDPGAKYQAILFTDQPLLFDDRQSIP